MITVEELSPTLDKGAFLPLLEAGELHLVHGLDCLYGAYLDGTLAGCCGRRSNVLQCAAVLPEARGEGVLSALVSRLLTDIRMEGHGEAFVFTRPGSVKRFLPLGFTLLAQTGAAAFLCSRKDGVTRWAGSLSQPLPHALPGRPYAHGCVVMNANPFTLGHQYLIRQAASRCGRLTVLVVEADASRFSFPKRFAMVQAGVSHLHNVRVCPGGPFVISMATFPTYFLKEPGQAARVHAALDAALFAKQVAPALGVDARFVGSEPGDPMTGEYNAALANALPPAGIALEVVERLVIGGQAVSAARVRALLDAGDLAAARLLAPESTHPFFTGSPAPAYPSPSV